MSLATRTTLERALAAYLSTLTLGGTSIATLGGKFLGEAAADPVHPLAVHCICGEVGEDGELPAGWDALQLPALVISATNSTPHACGYDECDVSLTCISTPDEINAPTQTQARAGWLSAVFDESRIDDIAALLSPPASGPDTRTVQGLHVIGIMRAGEAHTASGRHILDSVRLKISAIGLDA